MKTGGVGPLCPSKLFKALNSDLELPFHATDQTVLVANVWGEASQLEVIGFELNNLL